MIFFKMWKMFAIKLSIFHELLDLLTSVCMYLANLSCLQLIYAKPESSIIVGTTILSVALPLDNVLIMRLS